MITIESNNLEDTLDLGRRIGRIVKPGDIISLDGDLGAGKTVLTRGIAEGMGLDADDVMSPTFAIVNEYEKEGVTPLFHFDTYRLQDADDFLACGLDEYFGRGGVCVIEWGNIIGDILPGNAARIEITGVGDKRVIKIEGIGLC
ncbi:MAG: tRNA (adenosine(37)-N6)-threonylcarbamoyltransferase complex ATPase subunit type 1 TsaE [Clostridiales bacterium]|nr:tRNA (adenosine(37)-N6)-threonylcarbamoyltransferase complex ATPase subunit type 1 TsaE [Clostridiales bacterium]